MARNEGGAPDPNGRPPAGPCRGSREGTRGSVQGRGAAAARTRYGTVVPAEFTPSWWLPGPHLQTLWPALLRPTRAVSLTRERLELPDGDFIDVDWAGDAGPIVVILHGLQGSSRSPHVQGLLRAFVRRGWRGAVMHFRGCGGEANRLPRTYPFRRDR